MSNILEHVKRLRLVRDTAYDVDLVTSLRAVLADHEEMSYLLRPRHKAGAAWEFAVFGDRLAARMLDSDGEPDGRWMLYAHVVTNGQSSFRVAVHEDTGDMFIPKEEDRQVVYRRVHHVLSSVVFKSRDAAHVGLYLLAAELTHNAK